MLDSRFWSWRFSHRATIGLLALMSGLLLVFYRPMVVGPLLGLPEGGEFIVPLAFGLLLSIGLLGLLRPDLLVALSIATIPFTYRSRGFWDANFPVINDKYFPLHEILLWMAVLATCFWLAVIWLRKRPRLMFDWREVVLPGIWLLVGLIGVFMATQQGAPQAWREWRWMFLEPLVLYALIRFWGRSFEIRWTFVAVFLISGLFVALVALLQRRGIDLTPLDGTGQCYSDFVVNTGGVERTSSVFCHPNNLALWLGRVWPLALLLTIGLWISRRPYWQRLVPPLGSSVWRIFAAGAALITLSSMILTYSKGARFAGAIVLIALSLIPRRWWFTALTTLFLGGLLAYSSFNGPERLNITGDSSFARLSLWRSSARMIADHPAGIGLDQFALYYNPAEGDGYIEQDVKETEATTSHPHNVMLDTWLRVGPWGLLVLCWVLGRTLKRGWTVWQHANAECWLALGLLAAGAVGVLHGLVDHMYFTIELAVTTWVLIGLIDVLWSRTKLP